MTQVISGLARLSCLCDTGHIRARARLSCLCDTGHIRARLG